MASKALVSSVAALPDFPDVVPSSIRQKARSKLLSDLDKLQTVIDGTEKDNIRVAAIKLKAQIAGVLSSASLPRDVVEEKIRATGKFLRQELGDETYATLADGLTAIWDV